MASFLSGLIRGAGAARLGYNQGQEEHQERQTAVDKAAEQQRMMALKMQLEDQHRQRTQDNSDRDFGLQQDKFAWEKGKPAKLSAPIQGSEEWKDARRFESDLTLDRGRKLRGIPTYGQSNPRDKTDSSRSWVRNRAIALTKSGKGEDGLPEPGLPLSQAITQAQQEWHATSGESADFSDVKSGQSSSRANGTPSKIPAGMNPTAVSRGDYLDDADLYEMLRGEGGTHAMAVAKVEARRMKKAKK